MIACIYCRVEKDGSEFSLEHAIPQFLGGAHAPDKYKTRHVCRKCNSNLGLFVDASFEKSWLVTNRLRVASFANFDPAGDAGLPLLCLGASDLIPPDIDEDETCETWLGPLGERVFWIRPKDDRLYWYMGGNPRSTKSVPSRAYFCFSEQSTKDPRLPWFSFRDAFEGRDVKKIMCSKVDGASPGDIGFSEPDQLDLKRIAFFLDKCTKNQREAIHIAVDVKYDHRFMAKIAIGVGYCLFGRSALESPYANELFKTLWHREGEPPSVVQGATPLTSPNDPLFAELTGERYATTLLVMPSPEGIVLNLNLGAAMHWTIKCAALEGLQPADMQVLGHGRVIILYRQLQWGKEMALEDFLAHKNGSHPDADLASLQSRVRPFENYLAGLP